VTDSAGGVSPTAPDEHEETTDEALWDFANDLLDAWNIEDTNSPSLIEDFRDRFVARFRPSREASTEPQPITDADVEVAARAIFAEEQCDKRQKATPESLAENWSNRLNERDQGEYRDIARAALEAVEASRSPKPTEHTEGSA